jgi:hypothetical protein
MSTLSLDSIRSAHTDGPSAIAGTLALAAVTIPLAWFGWSAYTHWRDAPHYSSTTFCQINAPAPEANVVLVDATDRLSERHRLALRNALTPLLSDTNPPVAARGLVSIQAIDGQASSRGLLRPIASLCRPPLLSSESATRATEQRLRPNHVKYTQLLSKAADEVSAIVPDSDVSPLLEALKAVSRQPAFASVTGPRRITVVSDLLINVPGITERDNATLDFKRFLSTPYGQEMRADLRGVKVTLVYLLRNRAHHMQTEAHLRFWHDWLAANGAEVVEISRVAE